MSKPIRGKKPIDENEGMDPLRPSVSRLSGSPTASSWDDFVREHPDGTLFHLSAWQRVIEKSFGHEPQHLIAVEPRSGETVGILPLFLVRSWIFGKMLISTPLAAYGGVLADCPETAQALFAHARGLAQEENVQFLELRSFKNGLNEPSLALKDLYVTFRQELYADPEENYRRIHRKARAVIRNGIQNGLEFGADVVGLDEYFHLYSLCVRDLGTPVFPKVLFANMRGEFGSNCKIFSAHYKGHLMAAVLTFFYQDEVLPYYVGYIKRYRGLGVTSFLYWMLMKFGCENNYHVFDFGRSKKGTGSFSFKKHWSMTMSDLPYQYLLVREKRLPDTSPLNPKFSLLIRTWRRLPLFMTKALGPSISKHLT